MEQKREDPYFNIILDSIADGVFTVDNDWKITSFNRAAEKLQVFQKKKPWVNSVMRFFMPVYVKLTVLFIIP